MRGMNTQQFVELVLAFAGMVTLTGIFLNFLLLLGEECRICSIIRRKIKTWERGTCRNRQEKLEFYW